MKNQSAFPSPGVVIPDPRGEIVGAVRQQGAYEGMTLRDYFATAAMQARAAGEYSVWADLATDAYNIADAMLAEREKAGEV